MDALVIQHVNLYKVFNMICHVAPFKNRKFNSVDEAIEVLKEYFKTETSLDVELIYFTPYNGREELFMLKFLLCGFSERDKQSVVILDEITKAEANKSWITIFK